jgi:hypothetical protein
MTRLPPAGGAPPAAGKPAHHKTDHSPHGSKGFSGFNDL